ncbi:DUF3263 domain-containing protein [Micromonospora sp. NPDC005174]|uniref:DUF3263 domain-containing protein n=1 Tax=unclassified Micromonospora TaxID=2617518 RepID=UPI0033BE71AF
MPTDPAPAEVGPSIDDRRADDSAASGLPVPTPRPAPAIETADGPGPPIELPAEVELTERECAILAFEQRWWRHAGAKEQALRDTFGISATRYYQLLNGLLDNPAALAADPVLVNRLRRLRSSRARNRRR